MDHQDRGDRIERRLSKGDYFKRGRITATLTLVVLEVYPSSKPYTDLVQFYQSSGAENFKSEYDTSGDQ